MEQLPGIAVLAFIGLVAFGIVRKLNGEQLLKALESKGFLLIATFLLFGLVLALHLFQDQTWTADILKVLGGIIVGLTASYTASPKTSSGAIGVDARGGEFGDHARVAGRDINETIEQMEAEVAQIRDSVFHQNTTVQQIASRTALGDQPSDYLLNTVYERGEEVARGMANVVDHWTHEGWQLAALSSDYGGMDGVTLLFRRPQQGPNIVVMYHHGSSRGTNDFSQLEEFFPDAAHGRLTSRTMMGPPTGA